MSRIYVQKFPEVWKFSGSIANAATSNSGSFACAGYATLLGLVYSDEASETASGIQVAQSVDGGSNFDLISSSQVAASAAQSFEYQIYGNAVKVTFINGGTATANSRWLWQLKPVGEV